MQKIREVEFPGFLNNAGWVFTTSGNMTMTIQKIMAQILRPPDKSRKTISILLEHSRSCAHSHAMMCSLGNKAIKCQNNISRESKTLAFLIIMKANLHN